VRIRQLPRAVRETVSLRYRALSAKVRYEIVRRSFWEGDPEPSLARPVSQMATHGQILSREYETWIARLNLPSIRHRKYWEYSFILQALENRGLLAAGKRGIGFGVGREPLPGYMAKQGCSVLATDAPTEIAEATGWRDSNQHADTASDLDEWNVCDPETLARQVTHRAVDMNAIPADLRDFDYTWSSCALEHLGSLDAGLRFVERSLDTLRPGGVAVHTTELNLSSDDRTIERGHTVIYRRRDIVAFMRRMSELGHTVRLNLNPGHQPLDHHIDLPPYVKDPHVKLLLERWITTSVGLLIEKKS
jgi:hypothetical protein